MAKNTGRGSRYAVNSPDSTRFQKAKAQGGNFSGSPRRHPIRDFLRRVGRAIRKLGR